ncbi:MAG: hypothetical protein K6G60_10730 [Lachnospiraceae bacterium]|nr:hypothetical protein [Lachnospiraceae bacterium]
MGAGAAGFVSLAGLFGLIILMEHNDNETLIRNAMREASVYDRMFLGPED